MTHFLNTTCTPEDLVDEFTDQVWTSWDVVMPDEDDELESLARLNHVHEAEVLALIDAGETNVIERVAVEQEKQRNMLFQTLYPELRDDIVTDQPVKDRQRKPRQSDGRVLQKRWWLDDTFDEARRRKLLNRIAERDVTEGVITTMLGDNDDDGGDEVSNTPAIATLEDGVRFLPCGAALCRAA